MSTKIRIGMLCAQFVALAISIACYIQCEKSLVETRASVAKTQASLASTKQRLAEVKSNPGSWLVYHDHGVDHFLLVDPKTGHRSPVSRGVFVKQVGSDPTKDIKWIKIIRDKDMADATGTVVGLTK